MVEIFRSGQICVTFFFVLSGFVTHLSVRSNWGGARDFWQRKITALGPLYYATLLCCVAIEIRNHRFPISSMLADLAMVQAWIPGQQTGLNTPAWFMSALVFCIAMYPVARRITGGNGVMLFRLSVAYWLFVQAASILLASFRIEPVPLYWMYFPLFHLSSFCVGIAACEYHSKSKPSTSDHVRAGRFAITLILLAICLRFVGNAPELIQKNARISLFALPFAGLVISVAGLPRSWIRALDKRWINLLGQVAFPIYLLQEPVYKIIDRVFIKPDHGSMSVPWFGIYLALLCVLGLLWVMSAEPLLRKAFSSVGRHCGLAR